MTSLARLDLPDWPRLMDEDMAAAYLGISATALRERGPAPKRNEDMLGRSVRWDRLDLDRWADRLDGQPLDSDAAAAESKEVERRFLEERKRKHG